MGTDLTTCSEGFAKGVKWLENELNLKQDRIRSKIELLKSKLANFVEEPGQKITRQTLEESIKDWEGILLEPKYSLSDGDGAYVLRKVGSTVADEFASQVMDDSCWDISKENEMLDLLSGNPHAFWFLEKLGLGDNSHFLSFVKNLMREQTVEGRVETSSGTHTGALRLLVAVDPKSVVVSNAVHYWLKIWREKASPYDVESLAIGILALVELDCEKYSDAIREQSQYLEAMQRDDGSFGTRSGFKETSYAVWALSKAKGIDNASCQRGFKWLKDRQLENGSWENNTNYTIPALLALVAMGEGPKIPAEFAEYESMKWKQGLESQKPVFVHTSPRYGNTHVAEIREKVREMIAKVKKELRISSPFIDMYYDEIKDRLEQNPSLSVKIITGLKHEMKGPRSGIGKDAVEQLSISTRGSLFQTDLVHSRMIIVDDDAVLVSSADLTMDQLVDKFNAGIWTSDKETVKDAIRFFDNLFSLKKQSSNPPSGS